ncbi:MAG: hypothetical protein AVO33_03815 [delta proteobacterium ML8_F1]|nr:MAG: hypothetical protein AVO33_03815 [delta proteobacterium ML8_F1]
MDRAITPKKFLVLTFAIMVGASATGIFLRQVMGVPLGHVAIGILKFLGGGSPTIAAFVLVGISDSEILKKDFYRRLLLLRVPLKWWVYAILGPLAILVYIHLWTYGNLGNMSTQVSDWMRFPIFLVMSVFAGGLEEIGWRGVLLDHLKNRMSLKNLVIFTGVVWALWHYPMFFIQEGNSGNFNGFAYMLSTVMFSGFLTYLVLKTQSIALAVLMHASINAWSRLGLGFPAVQNTGIYLSLVSLGIFALILVQGMEKTKTGA